MISSRLDNKAFFYAKKIKGIDEKNFAEALIILEEIKNKLKVRELVKGYTPRKKKVYKSSSNQLRIDDISFTCEEFCKLEEDWIDRITVYLISIPQRKDFKYSDMVKAFYANMWQNAYLDGTRDILMKKSEASLSFGPGYYGMDIKENEKFYNLLEGSKIGVDMKNFMMYPEKTCTGLFIKIKEECKNKIKDINPCKYCKGNKMFCDTCSVERRDNDTNYVFTDE